MSDPKDPAAKDLVEDLDKKDPNAQPSSPAPQTDDDDNDKKPGDPIGLGE